MKFICPLIKVCFLAQGFWHVSHCLVPKINSNSPEVKGQGQLGSAMPQLVQIFNEKRIFIAVIIILWS